MSIPRAIYLGTMITATLAAAAALHPISTAAADPNQDDQFLAVLHSKQIPAIENPPTVIAAGHTVCRKLDSGIPAANILDELRNDAYQMDPLLHSQPGRVSETMSRFIAAAVQIYCPGDESKIVSLMFSLGEPAGNSPRPFAVAGYRTLTGWSSTSAGLSLDTAATGDIDQPPPELPSPKSPKAKIPRTPRVVTKHPTPRQPPPPPQIAPPPIQQLPPPPQAEPPAGRPEPGSAADGSGPGDGGGERPGGGDGPVGPPQDNPAEPSPVQPRPPGMIQLVPW